MVPVPYRKIGISYFAFNLNLNLKKGLLFLEAQTIKAPKNGNCLTKKLVKLLPRINYKFVCTLFNIIITIAFFLLSKESY